jgi:hypothetical protein
MIDKILKAKEMSERNVSSIEDMQAVVRGFRSSYLSSTDYIFMSDYPQEASNELIAKRQRLRDLTELDNFSHDPYQALIDAING